MLWLLEVLSLLELPEKLALLEELALLEVHLVLRLLEVLGLLETLEVLRLLEELGVLEFERGDSQHENIPTNKPLKPSCRAFEIFAAK